MSSCHRVISPAFLGGSLFIEQEHSEAEELKAGNCNVTVDAHVQKGRTLWRRSIRYNNALLSLIATPIALEGKSLSLACKSQEIKFEVAR